MGNKVHVGNGTLKIEKYPSNIADDEWRAPEEVILSVNGDQRVRAHPDDYITNKVADNVQPWKINKRPRYDSSDISLQHRADDDENKLNNDDYTNPIYNIVRLKMQHSAHCHGIGSGVIIHHTLNKSYVLTAAHNVVGVVRVDDHVDDHNIKILQYPQSIWVEINQNTSNGYKMLKRYNCSNYQIHPKYIKYLQTAKVKESTSVTGYGIAIIEVLDPDNDLQKIKPMKLRLFQSPISDNLKIKVIGYPGDKALRGELYGMKGGGNIEFECVNKEITPNKLLIYDNIDTSGGQSGSPIFKCLDQEKKINDDEKTNNIYKTFGDIVGVHVDIVGTLLNDAMLQWIHKCTDGDCNKFAEQTYQIQVLLITSSKSKYAGRLNEIYAKCVKTEIMSTRRLYFEYTAANEQTIKKHDFLAYLSKMFEKQKKTYLIFYCGESDSNGNWIINNISTHSTATQNVTLNDIQRCAKNKHKQSPLYIVSDCNHSGNWVPILIEKSQTGYANIDGIQASSKQNEGCNAGTFTSKYAQCCFGHDPKKELQTAKKVGVIGFGGVGILTVGIFYDGAIKQPFHAATKTSQPTSTLHIHSEPGIIGHSRDDIYDVSLRFYNSWYGMDGMMTFAGSATVGSVGSVGFY